MFATDDTVVWQDIHPGNGAAVLPEFLTAPNGEPIQGPYNPYGGDGWKYGPNGGSQILAPSDGGNLSFDWTQVNYVNPYHSYYGATWDENSQFAPRWWFYMCRQQPLTTAGLKKLKRYLITKSTNRKEVANASSFGGYGIANTSVSGNMQYKYVEAEPQFPFNIFHISNSIYFERSDGSGTSQATSRVPYESYNYDFNRETHILCQNSGSIMEIWIN